MTKLDNLVKSINSERVYIQTHNFPDPDAIGSGYGLQYLLKVKGIEATICYGGVVDRINTQRMLELFNIDIVNVRDIGKLEKDAQIILVDTQNVQGNVDVKEENIVACIDHHMIFNDYAYKYSDIREKAGACASIVASYFYESDIEMPPDIAEALLFGLNMDTANLTRGASQLDVDMFYKLYSLTDMEKISYLENNTIQRDDLQTYVEAINGIRIKENICFTNVGTKCTKSLIAAVSDFTLKIAEVKASVVFSIKNEGIRMSVRNSDRELHAGKIIINALEGIGTGGGHSTMSGGFVPFEEKSGKSREEIIKLIEEKIFQEIKKASNRNRTDN